MRQQIIGTIFILAINGRWDDLRTYIGMLPGIIGLPDDSADLAKLTEKLKQSDDALAASVAANQPN